MAAGMAGELGPMPLSVRQRARRSRSLARRWRWRLAHSFERLRVPFLRDGIDSVSSRCICALVTMSRVRKCIRSTRSKRAHRARVPKRRAAVRCHALNDLSRVVTLPGVQQASSIAWVSCTRSVSDSVRMRAVSKVITLTAREPSLERTGNLVAASHSQATEPQDGFHIAQSSYGTEL